MVRAALLFLGLAGCDQVFGLNAPPGTDAGPGDGPPACVPQLLSDDFEDTTLCGAWGFPGGLNRQMRQGGGSLIIEPALNGGNGNCVSRVDAPFGPGGMFIEVAEVMPPAISYTFFKLFWDDREVVLLLDSLGGLVLEHDGGRDPIGAAYDPVAMRWWRLRPEPARIVGEVSPEGHTWTELGDVAITPPPRVRVDLHSGTFAASTTRVRTVFAGFNICPPPL